MTDLEDIMIKIKNLDYDDLGTTEEGEPYKNILLNRLLSIVYNPIPSKQYDSFEEYELKTKPGETQQENKDRKVRMRIKKILKNESDFFNF